MYPRFKKLNLTDQTPENQPRSWLSRRVTTFRRDEEGALLIFGVYVFILMVMMGGIGIDLMRFERDRANLQSTLDRAVLAAADLDQALDPVGVVEDYFQKAGLSEFLISVNVDDGLGYRVVSATASTTVKTQFMRMTGIESLVAPAYGTAEERIDGVEISLVLDVSGSMGSNSRLTNLKYAARDFIDTMMDNSEEGKVSISIIPYATQVSVPEFLMDEFNVTNEHNYSRCINFEDDDFETTAMSTTDQMQRTMHFDVWEYRDGRDDYPVSALVRRPICEKTSNREIMVLQQDRDTLKTFISNFHAGGNTSIDLGMKWGAALLDPSLAPVVDNLIAGGHINANFAERPHAFNDGETIKVIVLMTDGQNTSQYYIEDGFRSGNSTVWWNADEKEYSIFNPSNNRYYWPKDGNHWSWHDHAYGNGTTSVCTRWGYYSCREWSNVDEPGDAVVLSFADLWAYTTITWNRYRHYAPWMGGGAAGNAWYNDVFDRVRTSAKNLRTHNICDALKDNGVIIYTIGFEAPTAGLNVLSDCASADGYNFQVSGNQIIDAFDAIAASIRQLRLTQ